MYAIRQCFSGRNPFFIRSIVPTQRNWEVGGIMWVSRNPFFIRSIVPTDETITIPKLAQICRNPFFIRSIVPTCGALYGYQYPLDVAIPSSSGQSFQPELSKTNRKALPRSQSLLHQVNRSNAENGHIDIANEMSQSLLHQVNRSNYILAYRDPSGEFRRNPFFIRSIVPT